MTVPPNIPDQIIKRELKKEFYMLMEALLIILALYLIVNFPEVII